MDDLISRQTAIDTIMKAAQEIEDNIHLSLTMAQGARAMAVEIERLPSAQPEIVRCKDCKFYSPMNRETKTGICNLTMHQNFGDNWFCAGAERRSDGSDRKTNGD